MEYLNKMERFTEFFNKEFLALEAIEYTDRTLFKRIISEELTPSEEDLANLDIELSNPETAKKYLDNDAEIALIKQYKEDPEGTAGLDARNKVIENKLKYIHLLAQKAVNANRIKQYQKEDAIQNAVLSLIHGIDLFDPDKGVPFTAYAKQWIMAGITNPFNPVRQKSISADMVGKDKDFAIASIDTQINSADSDDKAMTLGDTIADTREGINPYDMLDEKDTKAKLNVFLKKLTDKESKAIKLRFSTKPDGSQRTFEEISEELGMSKMGAKMLIDRTIAKLKTFAKEENV
jgi:RNA polymerase sigma factor (sigma-70 family)